MSHGFKFVLGDFHGNSQVGCAKAVINHNSVVPALIGDWLFCFVSLSLLCFWRFFSRFFCFFSLFFSYRSLGILSLRTHSSLLAEWVCLCFYDFCFWKISSLISAFFGSFFFLSDIGFFWPFFLINFIFCGPLWGCCLWNFLSHLVFRILFFSFKIVWLPIHYH